MHYVQVYYIIRPLKAVTVFSAQNICTHFSTRTLISDFFFTVSARTMPTAKCDGGIGVVPHAVLNMYAQQASHPFKLLAASP